MYINNLNKQLISVSQQGSYLDNSTLGKSDPYCLIGILDKEHIESKAVRNQNLQDWEEQQLISNIYRSSVKEKTLDPEWNETFEL